MNKKTGTGFILLAVIGLSITATAQSQNMTPDNRMMNDSYETNNSAEMNNTAEQPAWLQEMRRMMRRMGEIMQGTIQNMTRNQTPEGR